MQRWDAYKSAEDAAIAKVQSGLKLTRFLSSLPPSFSRDKENRQICEELHKEFVEKTISGIRSAVEGVETSVDLKNLLDNLDTIVASTELGQEEKAWRPFRVVADNQAAHDAHALLTIQEKLETKILSKLESEVADLSSKVNTLSDVIASKSNHMTKTTEEIIKVSGKENNI